MTEIVTPEQLREQADIQEALAEQSREEIENSLLQMISLNEAAAARVAALESDLFQTREFLERERKINKAIKRLKGKKKLYAEASAAEPWHELVSTFNPKTITSLPFGGRVFLLGHIDDILVVEVPGESTPKEITAFKKGLHRLGMTSAAVIVKEGTRFLKLVPVDPKQREAIEKKMEEIDEQQETETPAAAGEDGPEAGDGEAAPTD